jgi:hypothetical protein
MKGLLDCHLRAATEPNSQAPTTIPAWLIQPPRSSFDWQSKPSVS